LSVSLKRFEIREIYKAVFLPFFILAKVIRQYVLKARKKPAGVPGDVSGVLPPVLS
jgi:hypothetical protein